MHRAEGRVEPEAWGQELAALRVCEAVALEGAPRVQPPPGSFPAMGTQIPGKGGWPQGFLPTHPLGGGKREEEAP